jgi:hypothetical protein
MFVSTKQTLNMLVRAARNTITDEERDRAIAHIAERLASTGPFKKHVFVDADLPKLPREVLGSRGSMMLGQLGSSSWIRSSSHCATRQRSAHPSGG